MKHAPPSIAAFAILAFGCAAPESPRESQQVVSKAIPPKATNPTSAVSEPPAPKVSEPSAPRVSEREAFAFRLTAMTDQELWDFGSQRRDAMSENLRLTGELELPKWDDLFTAEATKREKALMLPTEELAKLSKPELEARILATDGGVPFVARLRQQLERAHGSSLASIKLAREREEALAKAAREREEARVAEEQVAKIRARPFVEGMEALERYRASQGCDGPDAKEVLAKIAELEEDVSLFHDVEFPEYERESRDRHTTLSFGFADEALRRRCLDDADRVYRRLVAFYTGSAYAGIRDRAKLGIDDIRAARAGKE